MAKYILDIKHNKGNDAGYKARVDISTILKNNGYIEKEIFVGNNKKQIFKELFLQRKQLWRIVHTLEDNSFLVIQYPWNTMYYGFAKMIKKITSRKKIVTCIIIHDLNGIRKVSKSSSFYYKYIVKENKYLDLFDNIICHNKKMEEVLVGNGIDKKKIRKLEVFDYLLSEEISCSNKIVKNTIKIIVAGNLSRAKAGYIYKLGNQSIKYELFGPFYDGSNRRNIHYNGVFLPDELPKYLQNGFGLVWDGESVERCEGVFGEYMKINNPHKLSLYIASGIPVIVWGESAIADFVRKNKIGLCIDSLKDIEKRIQELSQEDIDNMLKNVMNIRKSIVKGKNILSILDELQKEY